jgi:hypothetical protein
MGQRAAGSCPPAREVSSCLLAARILSVIDSRREQAMESSLAQPERDRVRALLRSVAARSHENPMLLWAMTWDVFQREVPESRDRTIAELRRREPENLQVWLLSLGDESWTRERLSAAARSTRLDAHLYDYLRADLEHLAEITADAPASDGLNFDPSPVESAQVLLTGMLFAETMPRLQGLIEFCAAADAAVQGVSHADCWQIAERLTGHAESVIDLALGSTLMRRSARDPLQRQRAEQARLDYEYLQEGFVEALRSGEQERLFMQRMRKPGATEISAARLMLIDAGLPPELPRAH